MKQRISNHKLPLLLNLTTPRNVCWYSKEIEPNQLSILHFQPSRCTYITVKAKMVASRPNYREYKPKDDRIVTNIQSD